MVSRSPRRNDGALTPGLLVFPACVIIYGSKWGFSLFPWEELFSLPLMLLPWCYINTETFKGQGVGRKGPENSLEDSSGFSELQSEEDRPKDLSLINQKVFSGVAQSGWQASPTWPYTPPGQQEQRQMLHCVTLPCITRRSTHQLFLILCHIPALRWKPRSRKVGQLAPANEGHHCPPSSVKNLSSLRSFVPPFNRIDLALLYRLYYLFSVPQSPIL